jgi:hypothetical protein
LTNTCSYETRRYALLVFSHHHHANAIIIPILNIDGKDMTERGIINTSYSQIEREKERDNEK